jgi:hypothetical protein
MSISAVVEAVEPAVVEEESKRMPCKGNAHVLKYILFRVPEYPLSTTCFTFLLSLFTIYSRASFPKEIVM